MSEEFSDREYIDWLIGDLKNEIEWLKDRVDKLEHQKEKHG